jgi:hypothetical protein
MLQLLIWLAVSCLCVCACALYIRACECALACVTVGEGRGHEGDFCMQTKLGVGCGRVLVWLHGVGKQGAVAYRALVCTHVR